MSIDAPVCCFCGELLEEVMHSSLDFYSQLDHGAITFPGSGGDVFATLTHARCGGDECGYYVDLPRLLGWNGSWGLAWWLEHLGRKGWFTRRLERDVRAAHHMAVLMQQRAVPSDPITARQITNKMRSLVMERDGFRCRRCGAGPDETRLEVDHINPVAWGGNAEMENLQTLCRECNSGKQDRAPTPHDLRGFPAAYSRTGSDVRVPLLEYRWTQEARR